MSELRAIIAEIPWAFRALARSAVFVAALAAIALGLAVLIYGGFVLAK